MAARHVFEDDETAELRLRLEATTPAELFEEAGRALGEIMSGGAGSAPGPEAPAESVRVEAADLDALLVAWLDEIIYLAETRGRIYHDFRVERLDGRALSAVVRGRAAPEGRTFVKAATFHGLHVAEGPDGVSATVTLDI